MADHSIDAVAKAAGVHRSTVSRAFSRPEAVKAETREHVLRVAAELGYTMNPLAQALRSKTSTFVPLIVPNVSNPFYAELAQAMTRAAGDRGYQLMLCVTNGDRAQADGYLQAMQSLYAPFGVVAPSTRIDIDKLAEFEFGRRVVVTDHLAQDAPVPSVTVDNRRGIELAFEHLRSLGHHRIGYVSGISGTHTTQERMDAYHVFAEGGPIILDSGSDTDAGERAAAEFCAMTDRPTAIIAANDMAAFGVISVLTARGLRVPEDVSIIGFDGLALGGRFNPALTTIRQPTARLSEIAIDLAEKKATKGTVEHHVLEPELQVRASTTRPRS